MVAAKATIESFLFGDSMKKKETSCRVMRPYLGIVFIVSYVLLVLMEFTRVMAIGVTWVLFTGISYVGMRNMRFNKGRLALDLGFLLALAASVLALGLTNWVVAALGYESWIP